MKPWRQIARPHKDVREGSFQQAEFAADISRVADGTADAEYADAVQFFSRTYITEGMRELLITVARRLASKGGDPVIQLQTNFGGGKTHTLLAVYHMAKQAVPLAEMEGIPTLLDCAGITSMPKGRVAVIDGIALSPSQPLRRDGLDIATMWGLLAYELLGKEGYEMVAASDRAGTSPGKEIIIELLRKAAPCAVLMDEIVAFLRQLDDSRQQMAGTLETNMSFIQALTEGMKAVPNAVLLASLPQSDAEAAGERGRQVLATLARYFGRVEAVWKPVAPNESFEIVRRRLFDTAGNEGEVDKVCRAYADYYRANRDKLPPEVQEHSYYERLRQSYPIHPEIFDRLYEDWSTIDSFQRTRGVLQYMAIVIHRLWSGNDEEPMIMPGTLPLGDLAVRSKSTHYLPQGWDAVITREIDGDNPESARIDEDPRFGSVQAAHRAARTLFLGSAPSNSAQAVRGISDQQIVLGCARPGDEISIYQDAVRRMRDRMHYLFSRGDHYWFDTHPNLRREMEARKERIEARLVREELKRQMQHNIGSSAYFSAQHVFTAPDDIPDDMGAGPRLVLLPPVTECAYSGGNTAGTEAVIAYILGGQANQEPGLLGGRQRVYKNRLVFLAPDAGSLPRVLDQCRTYLAWDEIKDDQNAGRLNLDTFQQIELREAQEKSRRNLVNVLAECYKHLLVPVEQGDVQYKLAHYTISTGVRKITDVVIQVLRDQDLVVDRYSPVHLIPLLEKYYFSKGKTELSVLELWQDMCKFYFFQKLRSAEVLRATIAEAVASGNCFAYAEGKDGDRYRGFCFGNTPSDIKIDTSDILIAPELAQPYATKLWGETNGSRTPGGDETPVPPIAQPAPRPEPAPAPANTQEAYRRFYGMKDLDADDPEGDFHVVVAEIYRHFSSHPDTKLVIRVEIEAKATGLTPFDATLKRTVLENCQQLNFDQKDFHP